MPAWPARRPHRSRVMASAPEPAAADAAVGLASYLVFLVPSGTLHGAVPWLIVAVAVVVLLRWSLWPWPRTIRRN